LFLGLGRFPSHREGFAFLGVSYVIKVL
jgi:hypothetical protein